MDFKALIKEQREELEEIDKRERFISREQEKDAVKYLEHPNVLAILGVRRCGKSIFSYMLSKEHDFGYINFDDERLSGTKTEDLNRILEAFYELYGDVEYIVLDEIQNVPGWELFANRLRRTRKVIITGSNSHLLAGELATHLTGRYIDIRLFPFSFREFLSFKGFKGTEVLTTKEKAELNKLLDEYLKLGGLPEVYKFGKGMLPRIYENIITKDIVLRYRIRKREELNNLAMYLVSNFSNEISYSKLSRILDIRHVSTVSNWISYLEQAFLIIKLERFDFKLKQQFVAPKKIYCIDNGIMNSVGFGYSENTGRIIENTVAVELLRRGSVLPTQEIYYWKDHQQNEVDFIVKKGPKVKQLIQVTYTNERHEINEREIKSLLKASKELRCKNLLIITWDYSGKEKISGKEVSYVPLWSWLLRNESG
ncbi:MAG: ATP-binding protein [Methanomassiliicoccales archaeon]|nr:MAG: ATP-binding protein [Methanomassiliicoccales archaeon]